MMLRDATDADLIFYKEERKTRRRSGIGGSCIYVLKFQRTQKRHSYMEAKIAEFDKCLMSVASSNHDTTTSTSSTATTTTSTTTTTWFVSIGEEEGMCKVRSFGRGE